MTVQQAQSEINKCEQDITRAHSSLCSAAKRVGASTKECANGNKTKKILFPLFISLIGILLFNSTSGISIVLIIAGIVVAYKRSQRAGAIVNNVETAQKQLNNTIENNSKI